MTEHTSRRRFLKATAATGALAGLNAAVLAQGNDEEVILLGGYTPGWKGYRLPGDAEATASANPTLTLQEGTTYTLLWRNGDGLPHNIAIQDSGGNNLEVLEPLTVQPETFQQVNQTEANQSVSLDVSDGNVTGVSTGNATGNTTGNATGGQETTQLESLVAQTDIITQEGAVQGVRFTATPEMAQYICLVHPNSMVGTVEVEGASGGATNESSE